MVHVDSQVLCASSPPSSHHPLAFVSHLCDYRPHILSYPALFLGAEIQIQVLMLINASMTHRVISRRNKPLTLPLRGQQQAGHSPQSKGS